MAVKGFIVQAAIGAVVNFALGMLSRLLFSRSGSTRLVRHGPKAGDVQVNASAYGLRVPRVFVSGRVAGHLIWKRAAPIEHEKRTVTTTTTGGGGGKGGGGGGSSTTTTETIEYYYTLPMAFALCEGPIVGIQKIWANGKLVYDISPEASDSAFNESLKFRNGLDIHTGGATQGADGTIQAQEGIANTPAYRGLAYVVFRDQGLNISNYGNTIPQLSFLVVQRGHYDGAGRLHIDRGTLQEIFDTLCAEAGLAGDEYVTTPLSGIAVDGYVIDEANQSLRESLEDLMEVYLVDAVPAGGRILFRPRGTVGTPVHEIGHWQLLEDPEIRFEQQAEIPDTVALSVTGIEHDYQQITATGSTPGIGRASTVSVSSPLVMDAPAARRQAQILTDYAWYATRGFKLRLPPAYNDLEPGDPVRLLDAHGLRHDLVLDRVTRDGALECEGRLHTGEVFGNPAPAQPPLAARDRTIPTLGETLGHILELPPLLDSHDGDGYYLAATGTGPSWRAGELYVSITSPDGPGTVPGTAYARAAEISPYTILGQTLTALPDGITHRFDEQGSVDVQLVKGQLLPVGRDEVLAGANAALIGEEIVQFRHAELIAERTWRLSGLLRGRRGTEHATAGHTAGERFVLLNTVRLVREEPSARGRYRSYRITPMGLPPEEGLEILDTYRAAIFTPFAPVHLRGSRNAAGDLEITWIRRSRLGHTLMSGQEIPLDDPAGERYELEILDTGGAVARTLAGLTTPQATYTAADQSADFGAPQAAVAVRVYQVSSRVGRGRPAQATL